MPLRDHFRPPIWNLSSWEGFHGMWPATIVLRLERLLPPEFTAEPRVHLGTFYEIDVCAFEGDESRPGRMEIDAGDGGTAVATWAPSRPTLVADASLDDEYAYEVLVFDQSRGRQLVAAVEIVSPANKDHRTSRRAFVTKCAALLQQGVCVSIVDLVTIRNFNLYAELLDVLECHDPALDADTPATYAVTCRRQRVDGTPRLEAWAYPLTVGQPLATLPLWLTEDLAISLELEPSYEETCRVLRIT